MQNKFNNNNGNPIDEHDLIEVFGARVHNLKNIDIQIPKNKLVVITASVAVENLLLRLILYMLKDRGDIWKRLAHMRDSLLVIWNARTLTRSPVFRQFISIEQKTTNKNPRSTVGTITEIYDFLRLLFARVGEAYSYNTGKRMVKWSEEEIVENIFERFEGSKITLLAPAIRGRKGHYRELFEEIRKKGFVKVRVMERLKISFQKCRLTDIKFMILKL
jgi:excinuclease ABC subunit A